MVTVHYVMSINDGTKIIDDTRSRGAPITVTIGKGEIFPQVESALLTMSVGDSRTVVLSPDDAFGVRGTVHRILHACARVGCSP